MAQVALGHITVEEEHTAGQKRNESLVLEKYSAALNRWLDGRCAELRAVLQSCCTEARPTLSRHSVERLREKLTSMSKAAISHMVDRREFWTLPGKVPTFTLLHPHPHPHPHPNRGNK